MYNLTINKQNNRGEEFQRNMVERAQISNLSSEIGKLVKHKNKI